MRALPDSVERFLKGKRFAVAGVSRQKGQAANAVFAKLQTAGYRVYPLNPRARDIGGTPCYAGLGALPEPVDGVVIATHPDAAPDVVRDCAEHGVGQVWLHRSFGEGSASPQAVHLAHERGIACIVGGCPLMFCEPVDVAHRCMRWWLQRVGRAPS